MNRWTRHGVLCSAIGIALAVVTALGLAGEAAAADWTDVEFPEGQIAQAVVEDSSGNLWATTVVEDGSFGHVQVLWNGAQEWEDACQGLDWSLFQWSSGLASVDDKVFLTTSSGDCFARSASDAAWHQIETTIQFVRFTPWDGYLWSGTDYLGVGRLDPGTERTDYVRDGLLVVMDNPEAARAYRNPRANDDYLYVGSTVPPELAETAGFEGVTVYRLKRGSTTWEDTGLDLLPEGSDLSPRGSGDYSDWGVWNLVAMDGYVFAQVMIPVSGYYVKCFLFDERTGTWSPVEMPESETGWYFLASGEPCFVRNAKFYFPKDFVASGVVCDILDPVSRTFQEDVKVEATSWPPLVDSAQIVGGELVVAYSERPADDTVVEETQTVETSFVESVPLPTEISSDPGVIGTNFGLALLLALVFGFTSALFNETLDTNHARIARVFSPIARGTRSLGTRSAPALIRLGNWAKAFIFRSALVRQVASRTPRISRRWFRLLLIVALASLIYAFLDPTFGFSGHGASLFFSLAISIAVITMTYDGVQALISSRGYGIPAAVKMFPAAIVVAICCVILSRLTHFSPGYVYGFIGALAFIGAQEPDDRRQGRLVLAGAVCLLAVSMAAWFLAIPVAKAAVDGSGWASWMESLCSAVFVAGLEGLFFGLLPLSVMDGGLLFKWSKVVWAVLFGVVVFLFWHVLLNRGSKYGEAFAQSNTKVVLIFLGCWTVATVAFYLIFRTPRSKIPPSLPTFQPPPPPMQSPPSPPPQQPPQPPAW